MYIIRNPIGFIHTHPDPWMGGSQSNGDGDTTRTFGIPSIVIGRYSVFYQSPIDAKTYDSHKVMSINELLYNKIPLIFNILTLNK